jgi:hypothetical protein
VSDGDFDVTVALPLFGLCLLASVVDAVVVLSSDGLNFGALVAPTSSDFLVSSSGVVSSTTSSSPAPNSLRDTTRIVLLWTLFFRRFAATAARSASKR